MSGNGSGRRPTLVTDSELEDRWAMAFGKVDLVYRCKDCGKESVAGQIHTCSPQVKGDSDENRQDDTRQD